MQEFLTTYQPLLLTAHLLAMAIGLGGATVSDILFFKFLKDFKISRKEQEVLHVLKDVILSAIVAICITGILLFMANPAIWANPAFKVKAIASFVLIANGICLHAFIAPHLVKLDLITHKISRNWHRLAFCFGSISFVSWYSVFAIAGLKRMLPADFGLLLSGYVLVLVCGIIGSQVLEGLIRVKASKR